MAKKPESFWSTVKAIWKLFSTTYGNVRVDFCQPFSLKVCHSVYTTFYLMGILPGESLTIRQFIHKDRWHD